MSPEQADRGIQLVGEINEYQQTIAECLLEIADLTKEYVKFLESQI